MIFPGRKRVLTALAVLGLALAARAADIIPPGDDFYPGWRKADKPRIFIQADLFNHIDGGADLFLEFGFKSVTIQRYAKGPSEIVLEAYRMEGPDAALGVYMMKCGNETPQPGVPARNSSEAAQFTILKGEYFVLINNPEGDKALVPAMTALAASFLARVPATAPDPLLWESLPKERRIAGSERLIRGPIALQPFYTFGEGDILGLGGKVFGALANFEERGGQASTRMVIFYPAGLEAQRVFLGLRGNLDPYLKILDFRETAFSFVDFRQRYGLVRLTGSKIEISFNLPAL
jgi:hypothetical protein